MMGVKEIILVFIVESPRIISDARSSFLLPSFMMQVSGWPARSKASQGLGPYENYTVFTISWQFTWKVFRQLSTGILRFENIILHKMTL